MCLNVYLNFLGMCKEVFECYYFVLGGEIMVMMVGDVMFDEFKDDLVWKGCVMYVCFIVGGMDFMGLDVLNEYF